MKSKLFYLIIALVALGSFWVLAENRLNDQSDGKTIEKTKNTIILSINDLEIEAELADTPAEHEQGLSGRTALPENQGLLFIFDQSGQYNFWMKEMNFPIDIIWLDENKKIIDITANLATSTYPANFTSRAPAKYVLEVNAGFTAQNNIKIGNQAEF